MSIKNVQNTEKKRYAITMQLTKTAMLIAIMVLAALFIKIPFYPVPLTLQTTIAILAGFILRWKYGMIAMAIYMCMGLIGIPVFSGLLPGFAAVLKPSFGYVLGFIATAYVVGVLANCMRKSFWNYLWIALVGVAVNYAIGLPYFMLIVHTLGLSGQDGLSAFSMTVIWTYNLIYLPKDILLSLLATSLIYKIDSFMQKANRENKKL